MSQQRRRTGLPVRKTTPTATPDIMFFDPRFGWVTREEWLVSIPIEELCEDPTYIRRSIEASKRMAAGEVVAEAERLQKAREATARGLAARKKRLEAEMVDAAEGFGAGGAYVPERKKASRRKKNTYDGPMLIEDAA